MSNLWEPVKNFKNDQFKKLVKQFKQDPRIVDQYGWNPIHWAAYTNNIDLVSFLLKYDRAWFLESKTRKGWFNGEQTALTISAKNKYEQLMFYLIEQGASLDTKQTSGKTAIYLIQQNFNRIIAQKAIHIHINRQQKLKKVEINKTIKINRNSLINKKPQNKQIYLHYVCAMLSRMVYPKNKDKSLQLIKTQEFYPTVQCIYESDDVSGYVSKLYKVKISQENFYILAHSGTQVSENGDIAADFLIAFNQMHVQFALAKELTKYLNQLGKMYNCTIYHTGHSLGAVIAEISASFYSHPAITFQSPGSMKLMKKIKLIPQNNITTYLSSPNFINTLNPHSGTCYRLYQVRKIKTQSKQRDKTEEGWLEPIRKFMVQKLNNMSSSLKQYLGQNLIQMLKIENFIKQANQLKQPIIQLLLKDLKSHSIEAMVEEFQSIIGSNFCLMKIRIIQQWPVGPVQYFSLASLLIQEKELQPDNIVQKYSFNHLSNVKSIFYKIKD